MESKLNKKIVRRFIKESRNNGKTDQEIYDELKIKYTDKQSIALLITGTITKENKKKYKPYNIILLVFLGFIFISSMFSKVDVSDSRLKILLFYPFITICIGWTIYEVAKYNAYAYKSFGVFALAYLISQIDFQILMTGNIFYLIDKTVFAVIMFLSFYLGNKMFPNYGYKKLKKDADGDYVFATSGSCLAQV